MIKVFGAVVAGLLLAGEAGTQSYTGPEPVEAKIAWIALGEFCEPETVLPLPDNSLLVSNVCNFRKQGNGFLSLLDADGVAIDWHRVTDLDAPLGMALLDGRLYLVDNNRVKVFRWPGFDLLETIALETRFANDLAVAADGTLYVTDSALHNVVVVAPDRTKSRLSGAVEFTGANGIALDGSRLYVGGARLWCVDLPTGAVVTIGPDWLADIDGIEFEPDGTLQITPVGGPLVRYRGDEDIEILGGERIGSANHGYAPNLGLALIPTGFDNTVIAIAVPEH